MPNPSEHELKALRKNLTRMREDFDERYEGLDSILKAFEAPGDKPTKPKGDDPPEPKGGDDDDNGPFPF